MDKREELEEEVIRDVLERNFLRLRGYPNVLNVAPGFKIVGGKKTDVRCITFFVSRKLPLRLLASTDLIPLQVEGIPTDVVELNPHGDWEIGETGVSRRSPEQQRRMVSGVRKG